MDGSAHVDHLTLVEAGQIDDTRRPIVRLVMRARRAHDPFAHSQILRRGRSSRSGLTERRKEKRP